MSFPHHDDRAFVRRRCGARVNRYGFRFRIAADVEVPQELEGLEICESSIYECQRRVLARMKIWSKRFRYRGSASTYAVCVFSSSFHSASSSVDVAHAPFSSFRSKFILFARLKQAHGIRRKYLRLGLRHWIDQLIQGLKDTFFPALETAGDSKHFKEESGIAPWTLPCLKFQISTV
jgi:hypothetical protein